jgi:chaperonin GroES
MNLVPLYDRLIIEEITEEVTEGGILLTTESQDAPTRAKVLAAGPGRINEDGKLIPLNVKVGDTVVFLGGFGTMREKVDGEEVLIISEVDVLAIVKEETDDA